MIPSYTLSHAGTQTLRRSVTQSGSHAVTRSGSHAVGQLRIHAVTSDLLLLKISTTIKRCCIKALPGISPIVALQVLFRVVPYRLIIQVVLQIV